MLCFYQKDTFSGEKYIIPRDFAKHLIKSRAAKFIMVDSYEMDFMKGIVILVKVDEMCNILKSGSHCLQVER